MTFRSLLTMNLEITFLECRHSANKWLVLWITVYRRFVLHSSELCSVFRLILRNVECGESGLQSILDDAELHIVSFDSLFESQN